MAPSGQVPWRYEPCPLPVMTLASRITNFFFNAESLTNAPTFWRTMLPNNGISLSLIGTIVIGTEISDHESGEDERATDQCPPLRRLVIRMGVPGEEHPYRDQDRLQ